MRPTARPRAPAPLVWLLLAVLALATGGCGFQARGVSPDGSGIRGPVFVAGVNVYSDLYRELHRQLTVAGVPLAGNAAKSGSVLTISRWRRDSRVLSLDSRNKAVEYELAETVEFALRTRDGQELLAPQTERVLRIQYRPPTSVLGSARESDMLRGDMLREVVDRIIRRMAAAG